MLQDLLVMSSCSIEISKGNLDFLAPILGNTSILFLSHCSCLTIATRGSPLAMHISLFLLCHPECSAPLLPAGGDMHRLRCSGLSPTVCALGEKPARVRVCSDTSCPDIKWEALSAGVHRQGIWSCSGLLPVDQAKKLPAFGRLLPTSSIPANNRDCSPLTGRSRWCVWMF